MPLQRPLAASCVPAQAPTRNRHLQAIQPYLDAGFDETNVQQIGPDEETSSKPRQTRYSPNWSCR